MAGLATGLWIRAPDGGGVAQAFLEQDAGGTHNLLRSLADSGLKDIA